jgi:hypothetical protein
MSPGTEDWEEDRPSDPMSGKNTRAPFIQRWITITRAPLYVKELQKKLQTLRNIGQPTRSLTLFLVPQIKRLAPGQAMSQLGG